MTACHWIRDDPMPSNGKNRRIITHCGRKGWADQADEFCTVNGGRFEAYADISKINCKQCLKSAERISNGPWGCQRSSAIRT